MKSKYKYYIPTMLFKAQDADGSQSIVLNVTDLNQLDVRKCLLPGVTR